MRKFATLCIALTGFTLAAAGAHAANQVRISQVYGGGGSAQSTAAYKFDYVEIFNSGGTAVNIGGWTIEYGSATGSWGSTTGNILTFPANTVIQPCSYIFAAASAGGGTGGADFPITPDFTFGLAAGGTAGKIGLFSQLNSNIACGAETGLVDKVAYGPTATCSETSPTPATSISTGAVRNNGGMDDTDNNSVDFTITSYPVPHNAASGPNANCLVVPVRRSTWGSLKGIYR